MPPIDKQVVIVTGASRGIGAATAREFARQGAAVLLLARSTAAIEALAAEIGEAGGDAIAHGCDVSDAAAVQAAVDAALQAWGRIDVLVNNAGVIDPVAWLADSDPAAWARVIDINVNGVYYGIRAVLPTMLAAGGGTIVNVSSGAAVGAMEGWSHYCASKAAVLSLTRCTDKEYRDRGIRVLGMSPGTVATDMQRVIKASGVNRVSELDWSAHIPPEYPAKAIAWLCTPAADAYLGTDFSIKTNEGRALVGLPPVSS